MVAAAVRFAPLMAGATFVDRNTQLMGWFKSKSTHGKAAVGRRHDRQPAALAQDDDGLSPLPCLFSGAQDNCSIDALMAALGAGGHRIRRMRVLPILHAMDAERVIVLCLA